MLNEAQISEIAGLLAEYVEEQRKKYLPLAAPITVVQKKALHAFFSPQTLNKTRFMVLEDQRIPNPPFYQRVRELGVADLPDFSGMQAVTFVDVVVSHVKFTNELRFHELVHVAQYQKLGVQKFADRYVRGFLRRGYEGIPLEINAYDLEDRFAVDPQHFFSVEGEVQRWVERDRF